MQRAHALVRLMDGLISNYCDAINAALDVIRKRAACLMQCREAGKVCATVLVYDAIHGISFPLLVISM